MANSLFKNIGNLFGSGISPLPPFPPQLGQSIFSDAHGHSDGVEFGIIDPVKPRPRKLTRFKQSLHDLRQAIHGANWEPTEKTKFDVVPVEAVIEALGWWNPVHGGRPKPFAQKLLEGLPTPAPGKAFSWKSAGLMYFTPHIVGRCRARARTTSAGLALLKHWREKFPPFARFFDAYYSKKAEREIALDCIDLALGLTPTRFDRMIERNRTLMIARQEHAKMQKAANFYDGNLYSNIKSSVGIGANALSQAQALTATGMLLKQQQLMAQMQNIGLKEQMRQDAMRAANHPLLSGIDSKLGGTG